MKFIASGDWHINQPVTGKTYNGIPVRILDILSNMDRMIDFAIDNNVDIALFTGDYFLNSKPSNRYRKMFYDRLLRLSSNDIKSILIYGNHDCSKSDISQHSLIDLMTLTPKNIYVIERGFVDIDDIRIHGISWQYDYENLEIEYGDEFNICLAHCTIKGVGHNAFSSETIIGQDFVLPLEYFSNFDISFIGHIHKPEMLSSNPIIAYLGSGEQITWGEVYSDPQGFAYFEVKNNNVINYEHIPHTFRKRVDIDLSIVYLPVIDSETMYRVKVPHDYDIKPLHKLLSKSFNYQIIKDSKPTVKNKLGMKYKDFNEMPHKNQIEHYYKVRGEDFPADLWEMINE